MNEDNESNKYDLPLGPSDSRYFRPGEIVTAEQLNAMVRAIESLEDRVKKLEQRVGDGARDV